MKDLTKSICIRVIYGLYDSIICHMVFFIISCKIMSQFDVISNCCLLQSYISTVSRKFAVLFSLHYIILLCLSFLSLREKFATKYHCWKLVVFRSYTLFQSELHKIRDISGLKITIIFHFLHNIPYCVYLQCHYSLFLRLLMHTKIYL